jgi:CRISPR-associated protein Cas1
MIQNPTKLTLSKGQIALRNEQGEHTLPLEDIAAIILESPEITLTSALLCACMEQGVTVVTCGTTHTPNGVLQPFLPHSRQSKVARLQLSWSEAFRKRLWQRIVQTKITNQALCLSEYRGKNEVTRLMALSKQVQSGDPDNIEAQAAREYWPKLFDKSFIRSGSDSTNAALNYGYAVIRAFVARSQVAYGLLPTFGIHHESELNAFNLTDDVMEVFRPQADALVFQMRRDAELSEDGQLSKENRQKLATLGASLCLMDEQKHNLMNACDRMAAGLVSAIESKSTLMMPMPQFITS